MLFRSIIVLLGALALLPTVLVDIPAMADYPNHLARMHLLVDAAGPNRNPFYEIAFALYPNLAMDLIVPQLSRIMNVESSTRYFFFLSQLLVIAGAVILEYVVKGRHQFAALAALLTLHSMPFALGFVNFEFGIGIALFGLAAWIKSENLRWYLRLLIHVGFVCVLFLAHFFALGVYGLTLGLYELRRMALRPLDIKDATATVLMLAAPVLILLAILRRSGGAIGGSEIEWMLDWKPVWIALFLNGYDAMLSAASVAALFVAIGYLVFRRQLCVFNAGAWIALGFVVAFMLMPFKLFDSRMADIRLITGALLVLPAFIGLRPGNDASRMVAALVVCTIIAVNATYAGAVWLSYRSDFADLKASFKLLQPESFVLVGASHTGEVAPTLLTDVPMHRGPVLAVHYARSFVSLFYTIPGMQPVEVRPDLQHLDVSTATEDYHPPSLTILRALARGEQPSKAPRYLQNWARNFQYVYLVGPHTEDALPGVLEELARYRRFTLYAVRRP
jgi:hypothetical protein